MKEKTLLDEFACAVATGYLASPEFNVKCPRDIVDKGPDAVEAWRDDSVKQDAAYIFKLAKAMEAEHEKHVKATVTPPAVDIHQEPGTIQTLPVFDRETKPTLIRVTEMKDGQRAVIRKWGENDEPIGWIVRREGNDLVRDGKDGRWTYMWGGQSIGIHFKDDDLLVELIPGKGEV